MFITRHSQGKFCSDACRREGNRASWRLYGHRNKDLRSRNSRASYERNRDAVLERTKAYLKSEIGKATRRKAEEIELIKSPEKIFARQALRAAVMAGFITPQPCEVCGDKAEGHHPDYMDPFNVNWLCRPHHAAEHRRLKCEEASAREAA